MREEGGQRWGIFLSPGCSGFQFPLFSPPHRCICPHQQGATGAAAWQQSRRQLWTRWEVLLCRMNE